MSVDIHHGDCLAVIPTLPAVDLVYMDPPFFTERDFFMLNGLLAFTDKWDGDIGHYLYYVAKRAGTAWNILSPGGSLVVHVDPRTSHYIKTIVDDEFCGEDNFASEIIWRYRRWPTKTRNFQRMHDVLLRWVKPGADPVFNTLYEPLAASTERQWGKGKQRAIMENGQRLKSSTTDEPSPGVPLSDVWDISIIAPSANERTGFPTQKPEALLERVILSLSNPGGTVLDPFCGSGTTLSVATRLGRNAIGIDQSAVAITVSKERLHGAA